MSTPGLDADVLVVGAGICGLAAGHELARRGARVVVLERAGIGAEQSAGLARIFRIAHADARLCALALEAHAGWRRWEAQLDAGRLVGEEQLVVAGPGVAETRVAAMEAVGARWEPLDRAGIAARVPIVGPGHPWDEGLLDPLAGAIRVARTLRALAAGLELRAASVRAVADRGGHVEVRLDDASTLRAGHVVVCAGTGTVPLAASAGIDMDMRFHHHVRLSYGPGPGVEVLPSACLIVPPLAYGLPLGGTGRFAIGLEDPDGRVAHEPATADAFAAAARAQHADWIPRHLPGLDPEPVDEVRCVVVQAPFLDAHEDGFAARRAGGVIAFSGSNLMKFGPLIGDRLARTVLDHEDDVHPDLAR